MERRLWARASIAEDVRNLAKGVHLDFRAGPPHPDDGDGSLPPAWDVEVDSFAVGYEPVGATSIGTEAERRRHSRFSYLRTPADRLAELNEGRHQSDGSLSARLARLDKKRITQAYCSRLGVTGFQRDEAVRAMLHLDLDAFGSQKRIEKVALTVIRIVVNYNRFAHLNDVDGRRISETWPFDVLADDVDLDTRVMTRLSKNIKEQLSAVGFFQSATERYVRRQNNRESENDSRGDVPTWPTQVIE